MCAQQPVTKPVKNRPEDYYSIVETCSLHSYLCINKTVVMTYTINIVIRNQAHRDASIQNCIAPKLFTAMFTGQKEYIKLWTLQCLCILGPFEGSDHYKQYLF